MSEIDMTMQFMTQTYFYEIFSAVGGNDFTFTQNSDATITLSYTATGSEKTLVRGTSLYEGMKSNMYGNTKLHMRPILSFLLGSQSCGISNHEGIGICLSNESNTHHLRFIWYKEYSTNALKGKIDYIGYSSIPYKPVNPGYYDVIWEEDVSTFLGMGLDAYVFDMYLYHSYSSASKSVQARAQIDEQSSIYYMPDPEKDNNQDFKNWKCRIIGYCKNVDLSMSITSLEVGHS